MTDGTSGIRRLLNRARLLVALAVLVGVLAMHGFSTSHVLAGTTMTAALSSVRTATATHVAEAGMRQKDDVEEMPTVRVYTTAVGQSDCPMSHSDCLPTLLTAPHGKYRLGSGLTIPALAANSHLAVAPTLALIADRSPPDVSLARLCINRI